MKKTIILAMFAALCTLTAGCADDFKTVLNDKYYAVSYTHLTLPTKLEV